MNPIKTLVLLSYLLLQKEGFVASLTKGDVYENIDNCPEGKTGSDCSIPYEACLDERRKCFNNSKCVRNNKKDPVTNEYGYSCDCSYAAGISHFAGYECEHSSTEFCQRASGSNFCTNGGVCGSYISRGQAHNGCHCPSDFAGAHCQYLKADLDGGLQGEALLHDVGNNFWTFEVKHREGKEASNLALVISAVAVAVLLGAAVFYVKRVKKTKDTKIRGSAALENIRHELEADGSGTMSKSQSKDII